MCRSLHRVRGKSFTAIKQARQTFKGDSSTLSEHREINFFPCCEEIDSFAKVRYNLVIKRRVVNKDTNLGKMYFENTYIITKSNAKTNVT